MVHGVLLHTVISVTAANRAASQERLKIVSPFFGCKISIVSQAGKMTQRTVSIFLNKNI